MSVVCCRGERERGRDRGRGGWEGEEEEREGGGVKAWESVGSSKKGRERGETRKERLHA